MTGHLSSTRIVIVPGTSVPGDQAAVWLRQGALPGTGEEYVSDGYAICPVESVDGSPTFTDERRRGASVMREIAAARRSQRLKHRIEPAM